jgi:hypothetical protein
VIRSITKVWPEDGALEPNAGNFVLVLVPLKA